MHYLIIRTMFTIITGRRIRQRFTFTYNQRGHQVLRVVGIDAESGTTRPVIEDTSDTFICYSGKYYCDYLDETNEIIWMSERDGWNHLYLYRCQNRQS